MLRINFYQEKVLSVKVLSISLAVALSYYY